MSPSMRQEWCGSRRVTGDCVELAVTQVEPFGFLAVQGARYARVERLGPAATFAVIAANLALGGFVVMLKVLVSH